MKAIVTVFKSELNNREFVQKQLTEVCSQHFDTGDALILLPGSGKLVELLSILRFHKIAYGTHFDTREEKKPQHA